MKILKQVNKSHYEFNRYMTKARWASIWHQVHEVTKLNPSNVLEIGPGAGIFKKVASTFGIMVETFDLDPELEPDYVGSVTSLPFEDGSYDVVCAFQVLEHLPYETSLMAFREMVRVSRNNIIISLPDAKTLWRYQIYLPKFGSYDFVIARPYFKPRIHNFDGEHYWEVNKLDYTLQRIIDDFTNEVKLTSTYRVRENTYHRFFIFEKVSAMKNCKK